MISPITTEPLPQGQLSDTFYFAHFKGGGRFTLLGVMLAAEIEERASALIAARTNQPHRKTYLRDLFPGGFIASSAGVFPAYAAAANHPDDPTRPHFTMREFFDTYLANMPAFMPQKDGHMRKVVMQLGIAQLLESYPWLARHPKTVQMLTAPLRGVVELGAMAMRASKELKQGLRAAFADASRPQSFLSEKLSIDRSEALAVLSNIVGLDTRLMDMSRNMIVTAQRLDGKAIVNDYFVSFKDGELKDNAQPVSFKLDGQTHMVDVILATTAVPLVFEPHLGKYVDGAPGMLGSDIVADLRAWHTKGDRMGYVCFGNLDRGYGLLPSNQNGPLLNEVGKLERLMIEPGQQMAENTIRAIVGPDHAHFIEMPQSYTGPDNQVNRYDGTQSLMDIRESETEKLIAYGQRYINDHAADLDKVALDLAQAYIARNSAEIFAFPRTRNANSRELVAAANF